MTPLDETCETCGALPGKPCLSPGGKATVIHQRRTPEGREVITRRRATQKAAYYLRTKRSA